MGAVRSETEVLVVGGGPVGLTAAYELRRRGVDVLIVDRLPAVAPYAKAVGIQPRTVEHWDQAGLARPALDAATTMRGQIAFRDGQEAGRLELQLPADVPYRFTCLPQYETERVIAEGLARYGTSVLREVEFVGFTQDGDGVTSTLHDANGEHTVRSRYVVGCDGAHSLVRKGLGVDFEGDAFPESYMLGDVELDWSLPFGYAIRSSRPVPDGPDDIMVCIPLPGGHQRYRVSSLVDPELVGTGAPASGDGVTHGLQSGPAPELRHIQAVLDRLSPQPTNASNLRWSSIFRISHRLASAYGSGRAFVAGDAAHIHPPTGAQGMNTGIQDAVNLAWKLAYAVRGEAADGLLESYHAERHPVGEEVVGRTVRSARSGIGADGSDLPTLMAREAQLLVGYPDSPLVGEDVSGALTGPVPGQRATDAGGLRQDAAGFPVRLHTLLRHPGHTLVLWAGSADTLVRHGAITAAVRAVLAASVECYVIVGANLPADTSGRVLRDAEGAFAAAYGTGSAEAAAYLIRPDGYVGYRTDAPTAEGILRHLRRTLSW
jgi:2-polyprenyl-6-methoxyphenol hydroxylase-like FAD-dependent oxidoreductase